MTDARRYAGTLHLDGGGREQTYGRWVRDEHYQSLRTEVAQLKKSVRHRNEIILNLIGGERDRTWTRAVTYGEARAALAEEGDGDAE